MDPKGLSLCTFECVGDGSRRSYTDHLTIDSNSLLVRVVKSFDHELDSGVTLTYRCHDPVTSNVTSSCRARVVINDVNDEAPHIRFSNSTRAKYDRLSPIQVTGEVCRATETRRHRRIRKRGHGRARPPLPPKSRKYFSGNYHVKFGYFSGASIM